MSVSGAVPMRPLALHNPVPNPVLARRLPPELAWRYHALPVAEDSGRITIAMADPHDATAYEAVASALGTRPCVVWGDPAAIDALLAEVWPEQVRCSPRLLVCAEASPIADDVRIYARAVGDLLGARVSHFQAQAGAGTTYDTLAEEVGRAAYDLVIFGEPHQSVLDRLPTSLLLVRRPRWPLRRLLLVIRGEETDGAALDWVVRLAWLTGATVTVLAVVPPVPAICHGMARMEQGLAALLATDTALGRQMRRVARRLVNGGIEGILRLRQGSPEWQIHREVAEGNYDLIVVTAEPHGWWLRRLIGEMVGPLLRWADRPVLVAK